MYIGLIGSTFLCRKGRTAALGVPEISTLSLIYDSVTDAPALARENQSRVDALFFLGVAPYLFSLNSVPRTIPWFCIGMPREGIMAALLQARAHLDGKVRFSIDALAEKDAFELLDEAALDVQAVYTIPYRPTTDHEDKLVAFHSRCYEEGKVDFCLTWLFTAYQILLQRNIPAYYISPTVHSIQMALAHAVTEINAQKGDRLKTVVGAYAVENLSFLSAEQIVEIKDFMVFQALKNDLLPMEKSPSLFQTAESYGQFLVTTKNFTCSPVKDALKKSYPQLHVRVGYGLAPVISVAEEWAMRALESVLPGEGSADCLFDGKDYRRMGNSDSPPQPTERLRRIACRMNVTDTTLLRYLNALGALESPFSAKEFAHVARIQPQASRKIFTLLLRENVLETAGKRPAASKGRPEILYRLQDLD